MAVEKMKQLELEGIAKSLETPEEDAGQISDAARERFELMVAKTLTPPQEGEGPTPNPPHLSSGVNGEGDKAEWFAQYLELAKAGFAWRVAAYIAWASSPKIDRWPKTQNQFAREILGLTSDRVIIGWRQKNPSIDSTIGQLQSQPLFEHRADIFGALIKSATNPDYKSHQDRKLALEILGDYNPKIKIEDERKGSGTNDMAHLSDLELEALGRARMEELRAEKESQAGKVDEEKDPD